ncbi:hypothetical protein DB88DRAFT_127894 [Papiliotrema laurentii]|uniref:Uncharacterized protein n=1 Tax=Papiliotrema laurentii TaxID=5418 RepID=A0AAD9CSE2_PAPLA|nr:hypothetical protein DB88DRAFT_130141 [Papiliotrema laurentii]KAK1920722.1 hypothetical protein DB88DRAFT_127894 [Papiliotrema laurentii]
MDLPGVITMMGHPYLLHPVPHSGPDRRLGSDAFIAPFVIAWVLGPRFFFWESRVTPESAVLPSSV